MRSVCCDVSQKWLAGSLLRPDELPGVVKPDIRAESLNSFWFRVVKVTAIEVGVVPEVRSLTDSTTAMPHDFIKAAIFRAERVVISQVPLTEHARGVAGFFEDLPHRDFVFTKHRPAHDGVPDTGAVGPVTGKKSRSRR